MAQKIKKDDRVYVKTGRSKGLIGVVEAILTKTGRAVVKGVAIYKRRRRHSSGTRSHVEEKPVSIDLSNLYPVAPSGKWGPIGFLIKENGQKVRILKKTKEEIDG